METHKKLKFTEKLSYGIADLPEAANSIIAAFLTMFYTDNITCSGSRWYDVLYI